MDLGVGSIVEGKVTSITKFGAFVALPTGRTGMVHISEVAHVYVNDIREHLTEGQEVRVKIMSVDKEGRVSLSIKKAMDPPPAFSVQRVPSYVASRSGARGGRQGDLSFEDKLKQFMQDSQTKMSDLKAAERRTSRRGGRK